MSYKDVDNKMAVAIQDDPFVLRFLTRYHLVGTQIGSELHLTLVKNHLELNINKFY